MKTIVLSDPVGERVAEEDLARRRMLADYERLKQARDAEIRRERDFQASKHQKLADERNAAIRAEFNRQRSSYDNFMADRNAKIDAEYNLRRSEYERLAAARNAEIDAEYNRSRSEYERLWTERNDRIAERTRTRRRRFERGVRWWPLWPLALAVAAIVAFYLYAAAASLGDLTDFYNGSLGERYAFRYVMSAYRYSALIALSSALGGAALIGAFWGLKLRMSSERPARESAAGLPLAALGAMIGVLICVNAYIRMTALIPESLYGLSYVYVIFSSAAIAMFGAVLAWAGVIMAARRADAFAESADSLPNYPDRNLIANRYPGPPRPPRAEEIAKHYPAPRPPSLEEIAKHHPEPPNPPSADDIAKRRPEPPRPSGLDVSPYEATWRTRAARERDLDARLAEQLPSDDWILISGYRGSGGAIDRVIAGPFGVCALNVLHIAGRVSVNGHSWRLQRYNSDGVWVESTKIADEYGRSPSAQVNQFAKSLEDLLASRKLVNRVNRGVVLTHEKSRLDSVFNPPVEFAQSLDDLNVDDMFGYRGALLAGASADDVARAVIADHEDFNRNPETP